MRLKSYFGDVCRACDRNGDGTSYETCKNFLGSSRILARLHRPTDRITDGWIKAVSEANEEELSLYTGTKAIH